MSRQKYISCYSVSHTNQVRRVNKSACLAGCEADFDCFSGPFTSPPCQICAGFLFCKEVIEWLLHLESGCYKVWIDCPTVAGGGILAAMAASLASLSQGSSE